MSFSSPIPDCSVVSKTDCRCTSSIRGSPNPLEGEPRLPLKSKSVLECSSGEAAAGTADASQQPSEIHLRERMTA